MASDATDDFIYSPVRPDELRHRLIRLLGPPGDDLYAVSERLIQEMGLMQLVGRDPAFVRVLEQIPRLARSGLPVLITGETGTGKELLRPTKTSCARMRHCTRARALDPTVEWGAPSVPSR
jgi:DNA-binding NtrC family response regulator